MDVHVVCAVFREGSTYLIAKRPAQADLAGYWEFPGGKVAPGESHEAALEREIFEELGVRIQVGEKLGQSHTGQSGDVVILSAYNVERLSGTWTLNFHSELRWIEVGDLRAYPMAPADLPFIDILLMNQWPIKLKAALALKAEGKPLDALPLLQKLVAENPQVGLVHYHLGTLLGELGRDDEALVAYEKAVDGDLKGSTRREVYMGLSVSYRSRGLYHRALDAAEKGLAEFPQGSELEAARAMARFNLGEYGPAFSGLLKLLAATSGDPHLQRYSEALLFYSDQMEKVWT